MPFTNLLSATKRFSSEKEWYKLISSVLSKYEAEIIDFNLEQLEEGILSTGQKTKKYQTREYTDFKRSIGSKSVPNADLKVEGDFYDGFEIDFLDNRIIIGSNDEKAGKLERQYTVDIYGLTDKTKAEIIELIADELINKFINEFTR